MFESIFHSIQVLITTLSDGAVEHLVSANKRLFWGYLCSTAVLIGFVLYRQYRINGHHDWQNAFGKQVLLHPSSKLDVQIWVINLLIKAWLIVPLLFSVAPIAIEVHRGLTALFGEVSLALPDWAIMLAFSLSLFLLDDFTRFLLHYLMHKIPFLWQFHKLHHSAEVLTPITVYRTHPIESLLYAARLTLVNGIILGLGVFLFKSQISLLEVAGANIFVFMFNMLGANLRHSHIWLSWGEKVENWIISPAQHQIHHSKAPEHRDKNFGTALAIWDKCFRSHVSAAKANKALSFGLNKEKISSLTNAYFFIKR